MSNKKIPNVTGKDFWGPPVWTTIHIFAATFRPQNAEVFKTFLNCIAVLIPCEKCQANMARKLETIPIDPYLTNNDDAFFYSYMLHDLANEHITEQHPEKPKESPDYDEAKRFFFGALAQECKDCQV